jgi:hypothetical protein
MCGHMERECFKYHSNTWCQICIYLVQVPFHDVDEGVILDFWFVAIYYRQYKGTIEGTKSDCGVRNQSLDVRSTTLLVRQYVGSCCA